MDNTKLSIKLLEGSNYYLLNGLSDNARLYIEKLVYFITTYITNEIEVGAIETVDSIRGTDEISQDLKGSFTGRVIISGEQSVLLSLSSLTANIDISNYDFLAKESLLSFLDLLNGLYVTDLYKTSALDISLSAPKQNGNYTIDHASFGSIIVIPIILKFGTINFIFCE